MVAHTESTRHTDRFAEVLRKWLEVLNLPFRVCVRAVRALEQTLLLESLPLR